MTVRLATGEGVRARTPADILLAIRRSGSRRTARSTTTPRRATPSTTPPVRPLCHGAVSPTGVLRTKARLLRVVNSCSRRAALTGWTRTITDKDKKNKKHKSPHPVVHRASSAASAGLRLSCPLGRSRLSGAKRTRGLGTAAQRSCAGRGTAVSRQR